MWYLMIGEPKVYMESVVKPLFRVILFAIALIVKSQMLQYLKTNITLLKYVGCWVKGKYFVKKTYNIYSILISTFFIFPDVLCMLLNLRTITGNLETSSAYLTILSTKTIGLIKVVMFIWKRNVVSSIMISLDSSEFKCKNETQIRMMKNAFIPYEISFKGFLIVTTSTITLFMLLPFIINRENVLPFDSWYPFDYEDPFWYMIAYVHQLISTSFLSLSQIGIDFLTAGLMTTVSIQCDILSNNIRGLDASVTDFDEFFRKIAKHHKMILELSAKMNELFSFYGFAQIGLCLLIFCTAMFRLSIVDPESAEFFTIMSFISTIGIQLFLYCWFGNEVTHKSSRLHLAAYQCDWVGSPISFQKKIILFLRKTADPIEMKALHFFPLSIMTFSTIMKTSWSFFAVLRQVHNKKSVKSF